MGNQSSNPGTFEGKSRKSFDFIGANDPAIQNDLLVRVSDVVPSNVDQTPTSREGHIAFAVGHTIYFFGGGLSTSTGPVQSNDLYSFDLGSSFTGDNNFRNQNLESSKNSGNFTNSSNWIC